jgi:hypothetical protein
MHRAWGNIFTSGDDYNLTLSFLCAL